jgi:hypothetical protein
MLLAGINVSVLGKSHGGTKNEVDAIKDGIGYIVTKPTNGNAIIDNSAYNAALYQYADKVTYTGTTDFKDYINSTNTVPASVKASVVDNTSVATLAKIDALKASDPTLHSTGSSCNDNNPATTNDVYNSGGVCAGISIVGNSCNDNNAKTINDVYNTSGICVGTNVEGQTCSTNSLVNGTYVSGICTGGTSMSCQNGYGGNPYTGSINCVSQGLTNLDKYTNLISVTGLLYLYSDSSLQNIDGLRNLTSAADIALCLNPNITNLNSLSNLKIVGSGLYLYGDTALTDISALSNITSIGAYILIDPKNYTNKMASSSYICQNYSTKIWYQGIGYATASTKSYACN